MSFSITTERIILSDFAQDDYPHLCRVAQDPDFRKYVLVWLDSDEQIQKFLRHAIDEAQNTDRMDYVLAARTREAGVFAGITFIEIDRLCPTTAEIGIVLLPEFCRNGYGSEILEAYLRYGFEVLKMHRVFGKCDALNLASVAVMERCGLTYEGTIREHVWLRDHWRSTKYYGMLAAEYADRQS
ncbi:MAG: GNAT family N-acetyltransferase [Methanomicrobiales archaeon]|nr:GNAT family N-acetyltransferase [Methanomicrobiales archaeon]